MIVILKKIYEKIQYKDVNISYIEINNKKSFEEPFANFLHNQISITNCFIEMVDYLMEENDV